MPLLPTQEDLIDTLRQGYGLSRQEIARIFNAPRHPKTLRDEFAAAALPAACTFAQQYRPDTPDETIARAAYKMADAMLAARTEEI